MIWSMRRWEEVENWFWWETISTVTLNTETAPSTGSHHWCIFRHIYYNRRLSAQVYIQEYLLQPQTEANGAEGRRLSMRIFRILTSITCQSFVLSVLQMEVGFSRRLVSKYILNHSNCSSSQWKLELCVHEWVKYFPVNQEIFLMHSWDATNKCCRNCAAAIMQIF